MLHTSTKKSISVHYMPYVVIKCSQMLYVIVLLDSTVLTYNTHTHTAPSAPLSFTAQTPDPFTIILSWVEPDDNGGDRPHPLPSLPLSLSPPPHLLLSLISPHLHLPSPSSPLTLISPLSHSPSPSSPLSHLPSPSSPLTLTLLPPSHLCRSSSDWV